MQIEIAPMGVEEYSNVRDPARQLFPEMRISCDHRIEDRLSFKLTRHLSICSKPNPLKVTKHSQNPVAQG